MRAVSFGLWRFGIGALSFQEMFLLYLRFFLLMFIVLVCDVLYSFSLSPLIL